MAKSLLVCEEQPNRTGRSTRLVASGGRAVDMFLVLAVRRRDCGDGGRLRKNERHEVAELRQVLPLHGKLSSYERRLRRGGGGEDNQLLQNRCEIQVDRAY